MRCSFSAPTLWAPRRERWSGEERNRRELEIDDFQHKFPLLDLQEFPRLAQHGPSRIQITLDHALESYSFGEGLKLFINICEQNGKLKLFFKLKTIGTPKKF